MSLSHNVNSDSTSNSRVSSSSDDRVKVGPYNLRQTQSVTLNSLIKHETLIIPQTSSPSWSGFFTIDIREKNIIMNNITLQMVTGPVIGTSLVGYFNPAMFFFNRIEIVEGGIIQDTIYNNEQFIRNQLLDWDEDRLACNLQMGLYSSTAHRTSLSSQVTNNTFYIPLKTYFDECKPMILTDSHSIQLRIYMDSLSNVFNVTSGTLTSANILYCNAICKVSRIDQSSAEQKLRNMQISPYHSIFHDTRYGTFSVPIGNISTSIVLAPIVGTISHLLFTVRSSIVGVNAWKYTQLASFALLDPTSTNIVGGQMLPASMCANMLNRDWCKSSYNTETSFSLNDQSANFYIWSFSADPVAVLSNGQCLTSRRMTGSEQLQLVFQSALLSQVQVDVYAYNECVLEQGISYTKKMSL